MMAHLSGYFGGDLMRDVDRGVGLVVAACDNVDGDVVGHGQRPLPGIQIPRLRRIAAADGVGGAQRAVGVGDRPSVYT
jgi:hypothetical protein